MFFSVRWSLQLAFEFSLVQFYITRQFIQAFHITYNRCEFIAGKGRWSRGGSTKEAAHFNTNTAVWVMKHFWLCLIQVEVSSFLRHSFRYPYEFQRGSAEGGCKSDGAKLQIQCLVLEVQVFSMKKVSELFFVIAMLSLPNTETFEMIFFLPGSFSHSRR